MSDDDALHAVTEQAARRLAARSQWQQALLRARERFAPAALKDEMIDKAADTVAGVADEAARLAWAHKGKVALAGAVAALVAARKPLARAAAPLVRDLGARLRRKTGG